MKYKNTLDKGSVRYIIFREENIWYGVVLEFNIAEAGDDPAEVMASLFRAIQGYVEAARALRAGSIPLNQEPEREYEEMWRKLKGEKASGIGQIYSFGWIPFHMRFNSNKL